jgi:IS30 family transposase
MPRYAPNKMPMEVKHHYFELIRQGWSGASAAEEAGVSLSCGSLWFIDAGRVSFVETPISPRYLSQDDRIEIADGLAQGEPIKQIAARIGKSYQTVYRELARNRRVDGYQPWFAHNQAYLQRRRTRLRRFAVDVELREVVGASSASIGPRRRSAGGCGDATAAAAAGMCAPKRSMRRSTGA